MEEEIKITKAFTNWRAGSFYLKFPNGNSISTTFAAGSYSDNHDGDLMEWRSLAKPVKSDTVEIMITECPDDLWKKINAHYNEDSDNSVIGYVDITQWLLIVNMLAAPVAAPNK